MASGERKQTDVESDEEFEEMTSDDLFTFYFGDEVEDVYDALTLQLSKKRLDRVEKILEILAADQSRAYSLQNALDAILLKAFERMPIGDCSELLRIIFRHGGDGFRRPPHVSIKRARFVVMQAVFYEDDDSLDTLREFLGNRFVRQVVEEEQKKIHSHSELLSSSLRGDVAEVERLLARISTLPENDVLLARFLGFEVLLPFPWNNFNPIKAAAEFGHTAVVKALLTSSTGEHRLACGCIDCELVFKIACRRSNYTMAANMLSMLCIRCPLRETMECLSVCVEGTPEFLRGILSLSRSLLSEAGHEFNPRWLRHMLNYAILHKGRHHVGVLLDEIDQHRSLFDEYPWNMQAILRSRSAAILRDVLIRYPEAPTVCADCDPLVAIQDFHWPMGARLLVEAGAKTQGKVPPKFVGLLSLSLEDMCRIAVRRHMKLPLAQNVERLPLPGKVKRRLLYR